MVRVESPEKWDKRILAGGGKQIANDVRHGVSNVESVGASGESQSRSDARFNQDAGQAAQEGEETHQHRPAKYLSLGAHGWMSEIRKQKP